MSPLRSRGEVAPCPGWFDIKTHYTETPDDIIERAYLPGPPRSGTPGNLHRLRPAPRPRHLALSKMSAAAEAARRLREPADIHPIRSGVSSPKPVKLGGFT